MTQCAPSNLLRLFTSCDCAVAKRSTFSAFVSYLILLNRVPLFRTYYLDTEIRVLLFSQKYLESNNHFSSTSYGLEAVTNSKDDTNLNSLVFVASSNRTEAFDTL